MSESYLMQNPLVAINVYKVTIYFMVILLLSPSLGFWMMIPAAVTWTGLNWWIETKMKQIDKESK